VSVEAVGSTPDPILYAVQAGDSLAAIARAYGLSVEAIVEANGIEDPDRISVGQALLLPGAAETPRTSIAPSPGEVAATTPVGTSGSAWVSGVLEQIADTDPGPPLTIEVSANRAIQDPLVEQSQTYQVTGIVRNDGDQTYALSAIHVTFFDAEGFRGYIIKYPMVPGAEWIWHGRTEADYACLLLAPGEECPFEVEITAQDMASFLIHPDAVATGRESAPVELSGVRLVDEGTGYLRISGTATNLNPFKVQNVTVSGVLFDASGQLVSLGSIYVLEEGIEPGESVPFELRVEAAPYVSYQLYAQAERDWN
jgi:LysM repeat protein